MRKIDMTRQPLYSLGERVTIGGSGVEYVIVHVEMRCVVSLTRCWEFHICSNGCVKFFDGVYRITEKGSQTKGGSSVVVENLLERRLR